MNRQELIEQIAAATAECHAAEERNKALKARIQELKEEVAGMRRFLDWYNGAGRR